MTTVALTAPATRRLRGPVLTVAGLALAGLALRVRDPHVSGSWGRCPLAMMGIWCPGCGGLRAVNDLSHGDLVAAASSNLLLVLALPVGLALLGGWTYAAWSGRPVVLPVVLPDVVRRGLASRSTQVALVGVVLAFTVLRNLPAGAWLAP